MLHILQKIVAVGRGRGTGIRTLNDGTKIRSVADYTMPHHGQNI